MDSDFDRQFDIHFMRIVNMCRGGINDEEIAITAAFCNVPQWIVMRVAHDMHVLTDEQEVRYQQILEQLKNVVTEEMKKDDA